MGLLSALGLPAVVVPKPGHHATSKQPPAKPLGKASGGGASAAVAGNATLVIDDFAFAKTDVPDRHLRELEDLRRRLLAAPMSTVRLVGNTDTVGAERDNLKLGLQRAAAVRAQLTGPQGIAAGLVKIDTAGETQPAAGEPPAKLDPSKGDKNAHNRRVEVFVTWAKVAPVPPLERHPPKGDPPKKPTGPADDARPSGGREGMTFEHQWDSPDFGDWKAAYIKGSFKVKAKIKGELLQQGSGQKLTAGYTTNKGVKALMELGKQEAVKILDGLTLKEVKETFEPEFSGKQFDLTFQIKASLATRVSWLVALVTGRFVLVGVEWKKFAKDPGNFKVGSFAIAGGVQGKGKVELGDNWEADLNIDLTVEGSAGPNWPAIIANVAEKRLVEAAETEAAADAATDVAADAATDAATDGAVDAAEGGEAAGAAISFEVLIAAGAAALVAGVIVGTLKTMIDVEEIRQLSPTVDKTTHAFRHGFAEGVLNHKPPSDPFELAAFKIGKKNFELAKMAALAKYPLTDKEIREVLREKIVESWGPLLWLFRPYAQQAVWDAFGSSHVGFVNRVIDPTTVESGYIAIYGHVPSESDSNYQKYYLK